ncbi:MAG: hypothetical protein OXT67_11530 [Zetaproteobacteria bacterium]|nr:hypothetical protein [Zetaproteobacteria bacterium]
MFQWVLLFAVWLAAELLGLRVMDFVYAKAIRMMKRVKKMLFGP